MYNTKYISIFNCEIKWGHKVFDSKMEWCTGEVVQRSGGWWFKDNPSK
jgi:hypothetical protein